MSLCKPIKEIKIDCLEKQIDVVTLKTILDKFPHLFYIKLNPVGNINVFDFEGVLIGWIDLASEEFVKVEPPQKKQKHF